MAFRWHWRELRLLGQCLVEETIYNQERGSLDAGDANADSVVMSEVN